MVPETLGRMLDNQYYEETKQVSLLAHNIQKDNPDWTWSECIEVAEQLFAKEKRERWSK